MFNIFVRAASRCLPLTDQHPVQLVRILQRFASFSARDVYQENSDEAGTLLARFAKHIALESHSVEAPLVPTTIRYADFFPITDQRYFQKELNRTAADQLPALIIYASTYRPNAEPGKYAQLLNDLDATALRCLPDMSEDTVLRTLSALIFLMPNWIMRTDFYRAAMRRLVEQDFTPDAPKQRFVQLCFFLGLDKKRMSALMQSLLEKHLEFYLPELSTMDLAVVANAAYKASAHVQCLAYNLRLEEEVEKMPLEDDTQDALLVTLVKVLRFQRVRSETVCKQLQAICTRPSRLAKLQARGVVHLFAYFAENLWDDSACTDPIVAQFMHLLRENQGFHASDQNLRGKDIATFLWCCAQLSYTLPATDLKLIESVLLHKVDCNEFRYFSDQLVDSCLSLWMLGYKSRDLFRAAVELKSRALSSGKQQREQPKVDSRLTVLISAAEIEASTWTSKTAKTAPRAVNMDTAAPPYLLKERDDLKTYVKRLAEEGLTDVKLVCPISGINVPSVLAHFETPVDTKLFVELITEQQTLRFSKAPSGLLRLKVRLLTALGYKVIVLAPADLQDNYTCLRDLAFGTEPDTQPKEQSVSSI